MRHAFPTQGQTELIESKALLRLWPNLSIQSLELLSQFDIRKFDILQAVFCDQIIGIYNPMLTLAMLIFSSGRQHFNLL